MSGKRVLIVDDEAAMRLVLSKQLQRAGFETTSAADGPAALSAAAAEAFDTIILDVIMPGMDGFEVCRRLKDDPRTASTPVIFLSASSSGQFRRRAFSLGAADFLAKPFQIKDLPNYIRASLRRTEERGAYDGRILSVIGASRLAGAAAFATRLAESAALEGPNPVMLIDLELPAGSIGAKLQLSGGPNMRVLLQDTGEPISDESITQVAQRYHGMMEVMPAPFAPSTLAAGEPLPARLNDVIDNLQARGYCVILHLGTQVDELTMTALQRSETIWTAATADDLDVLQAMRATMSAAGIARERILSATGDAAETRQPTPRAREAWPNRPLEPATPYAAIV